MYSAAKYMYAVVLNVVFSGDRYKCKMHPTGEIFTTSYQDTSYYERCKHQGAEPSNFEVIITQNMDDRT